MNCPGLTEIGMCWQFYSEYPI